MIVIREVVIQATSLVLPRKIRWVRSTYPIVDIYSRNNFVESD